MEKLNRLIQDASNQFECHNFHTALDLYVRCIKMCDAESLPTYLKNNLRSSEAAIRTILGQYDEALKICNLVLQNDKQHWLCLLRRSQIYKKQLKFKKAIKDLETMGLYAPDNMQVAALKLQIKGLMSKPDGFSSSQEQSQEQIDEQQLLKFSNLKRIDRTSVSIMIPKGRQSRVTISGDSAFIYDSVESGQKRQSIYYAPKFICQRFIEIDQEIQEAQTLQSQNETPVPVIKSKPTRGRSILKNRQSELFVSQDKKVQNNGMKLIQKLNDIEGKVITSQQSIMSSNNERQVGFRKSLFNQQNEESTQVQIIKSKPAPKRGPRKSCLKRSSFEIQNQEVQKKQKRGSRFDSMSRSSIDGKLIKSDKKRNEALKQSSKENIGCQNESDDDSDAGSYNIFGSKKIQLSKELRQNLGLGSEDIVCEDKPKKKERTRSILKKNSILIQDKKKVSIFCRQAQQEPQLQVPARKAKKSVMFMHQ